MKAIQTDAIFTRFSTRVDGSMSATLCTPELSSVEKVALMDLQGKNTKIIIQPSDEAPESLLTVRGVLDFKTPSQRLRSVLYVAYEQQRPPDTTFEEFYNRRMEEIIERQKNQLQPV